VVDEKEKDKWVWEDEMDLLKEDVSSVADMCRRDETKKMVNLIEVSSILVVVRMRIADMMARFSEKFQEANCGTCAFEFEQGSS
jgi:hypothetical protein